MKILVMGIGYVGRPLIKELREENFDQQQNEIYVTTTSPEKIAELSELAERVLLVDRHHSTDLKLLVDQSEALILAIAPKNQASYEETYLACAKNLAQILATRQTPLHLIAISSTSVYESVKDQIATEELTLTPYSHQAQILLKTEQLYQRHPNSCILRFGGIYGPLRTLQQRARHLAGKVLPGTGEEWTNHVHLADCLAGIKFCLRQQLIGIYNVVNNDHPTRQELYTKVCKQLALAPPLWVSQDEQIKNYRVCNQKIRDKGYAFIHPHLSLF